NVSGLTPVEGAKDLFTNKRGCASCHAGGPTQRGAKLENVFNTDVKLVGGGVVKADDNYIRNSILNPASQIVEGFQPIMPTFKGQVTDEQLNGLVAYVKSLSGVTGSSTTTAPSANTNAAPPAANSAANRRTAPANSNRNSNR